jgi:hypothetical protein
VKAPDFGTDIPHLPEPATPWELYSRLGQVEDNVHYIEPAFRFISGMLDEVSERPPVASLLGWARCDAVGVDGCGSSWVPRLVREFAPCGLIDGVWLEGLTRIHLVENAIGAPLLQSLMLRFGAPSTTDGYSSRYATLLRSLGTPPDSITRWHVREARPCADISYELALLGATIALFPQTFRAETLGVNLWMAAVGPCPLLSERCDLRQGEREELAALAQEAIRHESDADGVSRGFVAMHRAYQRWERAMVEGPRTAADFVIEMLHRKARFAAGHHDRVRIEGRRLEDWLGDPASYPALLQSLVKAGLIRPGRPDDSPLLTRLAAFGGPMFEVFTSAEQRDLREWIAAGAPEPRSCAPVALTGVYTAAPKPEALRTQAIQAGSQLTPAELCYRLANAELYPLIRLYGRALAEAALAGLEVALDHNAPPYSEAAVFELVERHHAFNVDRRRKREMQRSPALPAWQSETPSMAGVFDGSWLQGFIDVRRCHVEEYGWLFRIYASEMGDGILAWNHNRISRRYLEARLPDASLPPTERSTYDMLPIPFQAILNLAMALNTTRFMPELLGLNLANEATGVGGSFITKARERGNDWWSLNFRLHNSIDNYATGHTAWSVAAVQAYLARLQSVAPRAVYAAWRRAHLMWRIMEIHEHGTKAEQQALSQVSIPTGMEE